MIYIFGVFLRCFARLLLRSIIIQLGRKPSSRLELHQIYKSYIFSKTARHSSNAGLVYLVSFKTFKIFNEVDSVYSHRERGGRESVGFIYVRTNDSQANYIINFPSLFLGL